MMTRFSLRATLEIHRRILNSQFVQRISLCHNSPRLDFFTQIDWVERRILLKVAFPVDVLAPTATYEIQWGNVERPTHRNTSWDWARFETVAQKWVDLSEGGYGLSLLNDCKYGHDIQDDVIRLTLLRGTTAPDPEADLGTHQFAYSILPHESGWDQRTIAEAYALNDPIIVASGNPGSISAQHQSLISTNSDHVVIETVKQAEDGNGLIVRMYESRRMRGRVTINAGFPIEFAWLTNILEENIIPVEIINDKVIIDMKPYQIITIRLVFRIESQ